MPRGIYMDVHVPSAVTEGLRRRGIDVVTSQEDGTSQDADEALLGRATDLAHVLFTQDEDLLSIAADWQATARPFVGIVYAHQWGPGIGRLIDDLELLILCSTDDELQNRVIHLPLR